MCHGDMTLKCGGKDHVNVYSTSPPIEGLEVTPSITQIETGNDVSFTPSYESAGEDLTFQLDFGNDGGKTDKNQTSMWSTKYFTPGLYQVTLYGNDNQNSILVRNEKLRFFKFQNRFQYIFKRVRGVFICDIIMKNAFKCYVESHYCRCLFYL